MPPPYPPYPAFNLLSRVSLPLKSIQKKSKLQNPYLNLAATEKS